MINMLRTKFLVFSIFCIFCLSSMTSFSLARSLIPAYIVSINADGSIEPSTAPIKFAGNVYTLTDNISGSLAIHRSNIIVDGAGYALNGNGGTGIDLKNNITQTPSPDAIWNVTIKNLAVLGFHFGIDTLGGGNETLYNDYIVTSMSGSASAVSFWSCSGNNVSYCSLVGESAVDMQLGSSYNIITENNIAGSVWVEIGGNETVDRNYWSDYLTKYPNATEIAGTGIGDTPYVFYSYTNSYGSGLSKTPLYDYHPQMNPVTIQSFPASIVPELSWLIIIPLLLSMFSVALVLRHRKTVKIVVKGD
jgi:hypothetical protein